MLQDELLEFVTGGSIDVSVCRTKFVTVSKVLESVEKTLQDSDVIRRSEIHLFSTKLEPYSIFDALNKNIVI